MSGAGVNITPVAFLIVQNESVKLLEATHSSVVDKLVEYIPDAIDKINLIFNKKLDNKLEKEQCEECQEDDEEWYKATYKEKECSNASNSDNQNDEKNESTKKENSSDNVAKQNISNSDYGNIYEEQVKEIEIEEDEE